MASEGGFAYGAMERLSETTAGQCQRLLTTENRHLLNLQVVAMINGFCKASLALLKNSAI